MWNARRPLLCILPQECRVLCDGVEGGNLSTYITAHSLCGVQACYVQLMFVPPKQHCWDSCYLRVRRHTYNSLPPSSALLFYPLPFSPLSSLSLPFSIFMYVSFVCRLMTEFWLAMDQILPKCPMTSKNARNMQQVHPANEARAHTPHAHLLQRAPPPTLQSCLYLPRDGGGTSVENCHFSHC